MYEQLRREAENLGAQARPDLDFFPWQRWRTRSALRRDLRGVVRAAKLHHRQFRKSRSGR